MSVRSDASGRSNWVLCALSARSFYRNVGNCDEFVRYKLIECGGMPPEVAFDHHAMQRVWGYRVAKFTVEELIDRNCDVSVAFE